MAPALEPYTRVKVTTNGGAVHEGLVLPQEGSLTVLKLDNGYNIGLSPRNIKDTEVLGKEEPKGPAEGPKVTQADDKPSVTILHTGGTIASKVDYKTGGVVAQFDPEELLAMFPELGEVAHIKSKLVGNMQSDDFRFKHFNKLAKAVHERAQKGERRFIVTSGTDFLHYLSAALSFLLKDLPVAVLVVGAQRSSDRGSSDAGVNLACAASFLASHDFKGVGVCMHASTSDEKCVILPGTQVRKMHSSRRDAFRPVNAGPWAEVSYPDRKITLESDLAPRSGGVPSEVPLLKEDLKIGLVYSHPQMSPQELSCFEGFDGLVLAGSGLGHFPVTAEVDEQHGAILKTLEGLAEKVPVVMATQAVYGRVHMDVYSPGRALQESGVIGHGSVMPVETAYVKLAWLLSTGCDAKKEFLTDVAGELSGDGSNLYL